MQGGSRRGAPSSTHTTGGSGDRRTVGERSRPIEPVTLAGTRLVATDGRG